MRPRICRQVTYKRSEVQCEKCAVLVVYEDVEKVVTFEECTNLVRIQDGGEVHHLLFFVAAFHKVLSAKRV